MGRKKVIILLSSVLVVLAAIIVAGGIALADTPTPTPPAKQGIAQTFLDKLAANLGIQPQQLQDAIKNSENQIVDDAVKAGKLTEQQATRLHDRINQGGFLFAVPDWGARGKPGIAPGKAIGNINKVAFDAIAKALGMQTSDLTTQLKGGKTVAAIAQEKNVDLQTVKDAAVNAVKQTLDTQVSQGKITQQQEDQIMAKVNQIDLSKANIFQGGAAPAVPKATPQNRAPRNNGNPGNNGRFGLHRTLF